MVCESGSGTVICLKDFWFRYDIKHVLSEVEVVDQQLSGTVDFSAIITDSRRAIPGGLFFAISGSRQDGNTYIEEAMARGVVAVISEEPLGKHFPINFVQVRDVRLALAKSQSYFMPLLTKD